MIDHPLPEIIRPVLDDYLAQMDEHLPGLLAGFYLVGSIALDGYAAKFSDIDYVAVLAHSLSQTELDRLAQVHRQIEKKHPGSKMSGSYLQAADLGGLPEQVAPHPYYQDGRLHPAGHFELNPVTWWLLKQHGLTLRGPTAQQLPFRVDCDLLVSYMQQNLNTYWLSWTKRPDGWLVLLSDWGIQWTVLGVLRQFYTFREHAITTKLKAGQYALAHVPPQWRRLIQEALRIRTGAKPSFYRGRLSRALEVRKFLLYIIQTCNTGFEL
jgi:hypothetical protein